MNKPILLSLLSSSIILVALAWAPVPVFAQRGGHGGGGFRGGGAAFHSGGGFHGNSGAYHGYYSGGFQGGGGAFHGGSYYNGYRGGRYYGSHGGYYGWRGGYYGGRRGYWGYPGYGYGWGFGVGFGIGYGWGSYYWPPAYPYLYGYGPAWGPPYYPYYYPYGYYYVAPGYPATYPDPPSQSSGYQDNSSAQQSPTPAQRSTPASNSITISSAVYSPTASTYRSHEASGAPSNYRSASSTGRQLPPLRPEVQNVIRALRAMPPGARQREIDSGRYGNLSPQELDLAKYAADLPPTEWSK